MDYIYKNIEEARADVIGLKIIDFEQDGRILYLEDEKGRSYCVDSTGNGGVVVSKGDTAEGRIEAKLILLDLLLEKLDISEEELWELYE